MSQPILAVGVDPAKRVHRAVAVLFPDEVICDVELPNGLDAIRDLDTRLADLAITHSAELVARHSDFDWLKSGGSSRGNSPCSTRTTRERG